MASNWIEYQLDEIAILRNGAGIKQQFFSESKEAVPLVKVSNFTSNSVDSKELTKVDYEHAQKWKSHVFEIGDVVVATVGSWPPNWSSVVGKVIRVPHSVVGAIQNQNTCSIHPKEQIDKDFLYYVLKSDIFLNYVVNVAQGSANQARVPVKKLGGFKFKAPKCINEQKRLARSLVSSDSKIELNRQTNQTLEQMAQVLFKSWFVDFDPVFDNALANAMAVNDFPEALQKKALSRQQQRQQVQQQVANGELEAKPLPEDTRQLFPSGFEQTDEPSIGINGWIPKGWSLAPFSKVATLKNKSVHPNREPEKLWTQFSLPAFDAGQIPTHDLGIEIKSGKYKLSENTVLVSKLNPHTPRIWMPKVTDTDVSVCSTEFMPFEPVNNEHRVFVYSLMNSENVKSKIASRVTGTTGSHQRVSPKEVAVMPVLLPSLECITSFSNLIKSSFDKVELNLEQNIELTKLIDTLLPKLISGELQLQE